MPAILQIFSREINPLFGINFDIFSILPTYTYMHTHTCTHTHTHTHAHTHTHTHTCTQTHMHTKCTHTHAHNAHTHAHNAHTHTHTHTPGYSSAGNSETEDIWGDCNLGVHSWHRGIGLV